MPVIEPKKTYVKPKVVVHEKESIMRSGVRYTTSAGRFYARTLTLEQIEIMHKLALNGVDVEKIFLVSKKSGDKKYVLLSDAGEDLLNFIVKNRDNKELINKLLLAVINLVATLQNNHLAFSHPHFHNFVVDSKGVVRIIDFKLIQKIPEQFLLEHDYFTTYRLEFEYLYRSLNSFGFSQKSKLEFFRELIKRLNIGDKDKTELLANIVLDLFYPDLK